MTATVLNLTAKAATSRVLAEWINTRPGAAERASIQAAGDNSTTTDLDASQLASLLGMASASNAGVSVTAETAMRVSTVYGCVSLIAGAIATLPVGIFERDGEARKKASHDYWWLLNEQADSEWTSAAAWEYLISSKLFYGDGFAEMIRPGIASNRVIGWRPLHPMRVQPFADIDGTLYYRITPHGRAAYVLDPADVIHLPSLGFDGFRSPSPITYAAREIVGTAIAADAYSAKFFADGATFDYALKSNANIKGDQLALLKASLLARIGGRNSRSPLILTGGLEPAQLSINGRDAEILGTRMFGVEEICRTLGVPPHMVGHTTNSTSFGTGIEHQGIGFVRYTLQRHLTPIAQELNRKLWPSRAKFFIEHITAALERGDLKSRYEAMRIALGRAGEPAWMTINEVRKLDNLPPQDGGDTLPNNQPAAPAPPAPKAELTEMMGAITAMAGREQVSPTVTVHQAPITIEQPSITVNTPAITIEPPQVHVQAPAVTVDAPAITVHPPSVVVNVPPPGGTVQTITRDGQGDIAQIITTAVS